MTEQLRGTGNAVPMTAAPIPGRKGMAVLKVKTLMSLIWSLDE